jgi:hypothetical protein
MTCELYKKINHQGAPEKFKEATVSCPVFAHQQVGMSVLGILCSNCCIRIQMVLEQRGQLLKFGSIAPEDITLEPNCFVKLLNGVLKEYGEIVPKESHLNWSEISNECSRCKVGQREPIIAKEPTKITQVGRNELRTRL